ncbi:hypothetical protein ACQ3I4_03590 [Zafaria sp. Z1313]|uniref:hypothetical protein n=1 Tax=unclassified Zafaria TaxID=2828765 RepID=UPI002E76D50B|nr:hypothetical protein [Zafaria sp. J156]MEE1622201.1 hypothetical protein [Zafaria sp. J156]
MDTTPLTGRHGSPWTDADYELLARSVREGCTLPEIERRLDRTATAMGPRLRRMMPVDQRKAPLELVLPALSERLQDPDYDWRAMMLQDTPVVRPPDIVLSGIEGLDDQDLVELAFHLLKTEDPPPRLADRLVREAQSRAHVIARLHRKVEALLVFRGAEEETAAYRAGPWINAARARPAYDDVARPGPSAASWYGGPWGLSGRGDDGRQYSSAGAWEDDDPPRGTGSGYSSPGESPY